jgi:hypothetical protein
LSQLRIADLERDQALFEKIQKKADILFSQSPEKVPLIIDRWLGMNARFQGV